MGWVGFVFLTFPCFPILTPIQKHAKQNEKTANSILSHLLSYTSKRSMKPFSRLDLSESCNWDLSELFPSSSAVVGISSVFELTSLVIGENKAEIHMIWYALEGKSCLRSDVSIVHWITILIVHTTLCSFLINHSSCFH